MDSGFGHINSPRIIKDSGYIKDPWIVLNFKVYDSGVLENALKRAHMCREVSEKSGVKIAVVPAHFDLKEVAKLVPTFAQHTDPCDPGKNTGAITAKHIKEIGCIGTLINHSEKRVDKLSIKKTVDQCRKHGLLSMVCVESRKEAEEVAHFGPDMIAIELPELIGTGVSISKVNPRVVTEVIEAVGNINPRIGITCGAGVSTGEDVRKALELGSVGVLVSSAFVKASDPMMVLEDLVSGVTRYLKG